MKQREIYTRIFSKVALERIKNDLCPACGKPKSEWTRRTDWRCCSKKCTGDFFAEHVDILDWSVVRSQAFKRDNYTCRMCNKRFIKNYSHPDLKDEDFADTSKLIGDHIIPIAVGGEEFDINNVQTLCIQCNKIKTKRDANRIAKHRRREKELKYNVEMINIKFPIQKELEV